MLAIAFRFPAGRYHATSWDHHVNEGLVEWPPSPWRILRSLVASSYKLTAPADARLLRSTLEVLTTLPSYAVPPVGEGHLRHYMPLGNLKDGRIATAKILDAFVAPGDGELLATWPDASLDAMQTALLDRLLDHLTYLGRAESWVEARRVDGIDRPINCTPTEDGDRILHALMRPIEYAAWRNGFREAQRQLPPRQRCEPPADWWQVLHHVTRTLFAQAWSRPPGVRHARYRLDTAHRTYRRLSMARRPRHPTLAWFELSSSVRPRLTEAVVIGDRMRKAALNKSGAHPVFVGRRDGAVMAGHRHAFFLPSDDDADGFIDHIIVYAAEGFDDDAVAALCRTTRLWGRGSRDLHLTLIDVGEPQLVGGLRGANGISPLVGRARVWESHTPFVPPRHEKMRQNRRIETPTDQLANLIEARSLPRPRVMSLATAELHAPQPGQRIAWHRFRRERVEGGGGARGSNRGFGFRLEFPEAITGPIALGYGAHQGLGLFVAVEE